MHISWIILITLECMQLSISQTNLFTNYPANTETYIENTKSSFSPKGTATVRTITYNDKGDTIVYERKMTDEERNRFNKDMNKVTEELSGIGEKVVSF